MTPYDKRSVVPIPDDLKRLVPAPTDGNITVKKAVPDVEQDTMPLIVSKAKRTAWQTKKLAARLKGSTLAQTLKNDCDFVLKYIEYKQDALEHEQVRSPRRLIYDGKGDCDCFSVFLATLLINQGIQFRFRLAQYSNSGGEWTHIYIVVPKDQSFTGSLNEKSQYYVLDPVTNQYNYEVAFTKKRDVTMALQFLDGLPVRSIGKLGACTTTDEKVTPATLRKFVGSDLVVLSGLVPTKQLLDEKNYIYEHKLDTSINSSFFTVYSPNGPINVATVITPEESQQLQTMMNAPLRVKAAPAASPQVATTTAAVATTTAAPVEKAEETKQSNGWFGYVLTAIGIAASLKNSGSGSSLSGHRKPVPKPVKKKSLHHPVVNI